MKKFLLLIYLMFGTGFTLAFMINQDLEEEEAPSCADMGLAFGFGMTFWPAILGWLMYAHYNVFETWHQDDQGRWHKWGKVDPVGLDGSRIWAKGI